MISETTAAIEEPPHPKDVSQMKLCLGLCNVNRRLVPKFANLARPLYKRLRKDGPTRFELDDSEKKAVDTLKRKLTSTKVLELPRATGKATNETDA